MTVWLGKFKSPLSPQEQDEQCWLFLYFFITTRDGSGAFPESVRAGRTQRFIHHKSQHHRLFILAERPTSEAKPIKSSLPCPSACHLAHISPKTLLHSRNFSLFFSSHLSLFLAFFPFSVCCHSITFLTSNEERSCTENNEVMQRVALWAPHEHTLKRTSPHCRRTLQVGINISFLIETKRQTLIAGLAEDSTVIVKHKWKSEVFAAVFSWICWMNDPPANIRFLLLCNSSPAKKNHVSLCFSHCWQSDYVLEWTFTCFFFLLHHLWLFKKHGGSGITSNHSTDVFSNRNLMTQSNLVVFWRCRKLLWGRKRSIWASFKNTRH